IYNVRPGRLFGKPRQRNRPQTIRHFEPTHRLTQFDLQSTVRLFGLKAIELARVGAVLPKYQGFGPSLLFDPADEGGSVHPVEVRSRQRQVRTTYDGYTPKKHGEALHLRPES